MAHESGFDLREERRTARDRLNAAIVAAAARLLSAGGAEALSARDLAKAVGASTKVIYSHFGGMRAVTEAVYRDSFDRLATALSAADRPTPRAPTRLDALARAYRAFALENPHLFALMYGERVLQLAPSEADRVPAAAALEVFVRAIRDLRATGGERAGETNRELAYQFWAIIHGAVALEVTGWSGSRADAMFDAALKAAHTLFAPEREGHVVNEPAGCATDESAPTTLGGGKDNLARPTGVEPVSPA